MNIISMPIKALKPYEKNAKLHDQKQIDNVANSIRRFGWQQPIVVDENGVIIIGHCRWMAAKKLGLKEVPAVVASGLSKSEIRELRIADNKTNESAWDLDILAKDIEGLSFDGFDFDMGIPEQQEDEELRVEEVDIPLESERRVQSGQVWACGEHRLFCGDSTNVDLIGLLMGSNKADLVVTDPPYNMDYQGAGNTKNRAAKKIINDNLPEPQFEKFLNEFYTCCMAYMKDGASIYVFYKEMGSGVFMRSMRHSGITFKQELIWVKNQIVLSGSAHQSMYEPCLLGCKGKTIKKWNGKRRQRSVIESIDFMDEDELRNTIKDLLAAEEPDIIREHKNLVNDLHPTMKPVRLLAKFIENSSNKNDIVLDLFGGSGSTMMACEQLKRKCYMAELDETYCDVIIQRWENFTGEKAVLLNG